MQHSGDEEKEKERKIKYSRTLSLGTNEGLVNNRHLWTAIKSCLCVQRPLRLVSPLKGKRGFAWDVYLSIYSLSMCWRVFYPERRTRMPNQDQTLNYRDKPEWCDIREQRRRVLRHVGFSGMYRGIVVDILPWKTNLKMQRLWIDFTGDHLWIKLENL